jgi:hypothetical protein
MLACPASGLSSVADLGGTFGRSRLRTSVLTPRLSRWSKGLPADDWAFRDNTLKHRRYWLRYDLPVLLVLYNIEEHKAYWQLINEDRAVETGDGFKAIVPRSQPLDPSAASMLASLARLGRPGHFHETLQRPDKWTSSR